jgi:hypothetical protein
MGAWSVAFSSPPENFSLTGSRQLANALAKSRTGSVLLHDISLDPSATQLKDVYYFLYHRGPDLAPSAPAATMYCHPALVRVETPVSRLVRFATQHTPDLFGFTVSDKVADQISQSLENSLRDLHGKYGNVPRWLAATQRYVELQSLELRKRERDLPQTAEALQEIEDARKELRGIQETAVRIAQSPGDQS